MYELRANIGNTKMFYSAIYTSMTAARTEALKLQENAHKNGATLTGSITPLEKVGNVYRPVLAACVRF